MQNPLRFALLAVLVLLTVSVTAFRISYETNDDVLLTMIASGRGFCPAPDEHLIFSNILIGRMLKSLYQLAPSIPWYGSYLLLAHYVSQVALLYVALVIEGTPAAEQTAGVRRRSWRLRVAGYVVVFALVELVLVNTFQFTSTAFLAGQAGIFLLWLAARNYATQTRPQGIARLVAALALVVLAGLIRLESLYMALLMALPLWLLLAMQCPRRALMPGLGVAAAAIALVLAADRYNQAAYEADPAWSRFYAFNALRCRFNDYGWTSHAPETAHAFDAVGWSKIDHDMIAHWFYDDPLKYSEANLRTVLDAFSWKTARWSPTYLLQAFRRPLQDRSVWAVWLALPFCLAGVERRGARRVIAACAALGFALLVAVSLNNKIPPLRLYFPLLSFPLVATLLFPSQLAWRTSTARAHNLLPRLWSGWKVQTPLTQTVVVMLLIGVGMGVYRQARRTARVEQNREALRTFVADAREGCHKLYVCWEAALPFEVISPLDSLAEWSDFAVLSLTWTQRTPWQDEIKRRFGIESLAQAICVRDDIVLVATPTHREVFAEYAHEHFHADLEYVARQGFGERSAAGQFIRTESAAGIATRPNETRSR